MKLKLGMALVGLSLCSAGWAAETSEKGFAAYCSKALEREAERTTIDALARLVSVRTPVEAEYCEYLESALATRTRYSFRGKGLSSLKPFAYLPHATEIIASNNSIQSLDGLEQLSKLELLDLGSNAISDISVLKKLESLKVLRLANNQIEDISALEGLSHLSDLSIGSNAITDVKVLAKVETLQYLNLSSNAILSVDDLISLPQLKTLNVGFNKLCSLSAWTEVEKKGLTIIGKDTQTCGGEEAAPR